MRCYARMDRERLEYQEAGGLGEPQDGEAGDEAASTRQWRSCCDPQRQIQRDLERGQKCDRALWIGERLDARRETTCVYTGPSR